VLTNLSSPEPGTSESISPNGREPYRDLYPTPETVAQPGHVEQVEQSPLSGTAQYAPAEASSYQVPVRPSSRPLASYDAPATASVASGSALLVPRGAVEMLPDESVVYQLGALYLTNKRVILLAPSVVRLAFLRDVDAVGTLSERASGWSFFFGLLLLGLAGAALYFGLARNTYEATFPTLYVISPFIIAGGLALLAIYLLVNYFFWVKRTLFLSVGGRPLITVSITDWNARKLEGMDQFLNIYSQVKDGFRDHGA